MKSVLRQNDGSSFETSIVGHHALVNDIPSFCVSLNKINRFAGRLKQGDLLPVGTVEFVRLAMQLAGITEPYNISYPVPLQRFAHRIVELKPASDVVGRYFVKPLTTKQFTGFVRDSHAFLNDMMSYERHQHEAFNALPDDTLVWCSEEVLWLSEYRYYIRENKIVGAGRYDSCGDDAPTPDQKVVDEMVDAWAAHDSPPAAYSLDVGVLSTGQTALVECNDAWSLGYYKGTLSRAQYFDLLWA